MESVDSYYKNGWILYCPECRLYLLQSDPQNFSLNKRVIIDDLPCETCEEKRKAEVQDAQQIMGRLGLPKENQ